MNKIRDLLFCVGLFSVIVGLPVLGCVLAIMMNNPWWLWLLVPLITLMEMGVFIGIVAWFFVSVYMGW